MAFRPIELLESLEEKARKLKGWWEEKEEQAEEQLSDMLRPEPPTPELPEHLHKKYEPPQIGTPRRQMRALPGALIEEVHKEDGENAEKSVRSSTAADRYLIPDGPGFDQEILHKNIAEVERRITENSEGFGAKTNNFVWWLNQVRDHGPWDYKRKAREYTQMGEFGKIGPSPHEDFGNFNYGATAAALGLPLDVALRGAGIVSVGKDLKRLKTLGNPIIGEPPYGDDPWDQKQIRAGYNYYQKVWKKNSRQR